MPLKWKLKKSRQYNVVSKSLFVISIELLDGVIVECTLGIESTGQECLDNVCQRLVINQPEFFGLRYVNRNNQLRWVQLERPLKRQLDKLASSHQLYLRVMYYVRSGTSLITDEVTRNHYFLQCKSDVVEGRVICSWQQAVVLAAYSRQAEYGNHDRERHTVDYLKNLLPFPKQLVHNGQLLDSSTLAHGGRLECLTAAVIKHHITLHNMSQAQAEEGYIEVCQALGGYGTEWWGAWEGAGPRRRDVLLALSLTGLAVAPAHVPTPHHAAPLHAAPHHAAPAPHHAAPPSPHHPALALPHPTTTHYQWSEIRNVINHKRSFSIELVGGAGGGGGGGGSGGGSGGGTSLVLASPEEGKYVWRLCVLQHTFYMAHQHPPPAAAPPAPALPALAPPAPPHAPPAHHAQPHAHATHQTMFQDVGLSESREELQWRGGSVGGGLERAGAARGAAPGPAGGVDTLGRAHSTSCLELPGGGGAGPGAGARGLHASQHLAQDLHTLRRLLPGYRVAPDYETAMQRKYAGAGGAGAGAGAGGVGGGSQPELYPSCAAGGWARAGVGAGVGASGYLPVWGARGAPPPYPAPSASTPDLHRYSPGPPGPAPRPGAAPPAPAYLYYGPAPRYLLYAPPTPPQHAPPQHAQLPQHGARAQAGEPIYENVPVAWAGPAPALHAPHAPLRDRARSLSDRRRDIDHYMNAQVIKNIRESSLPREGNGSGRSFEEGFARDGTPRGFTNMVMHENTQRGFNDNDARHREGTPRASDDTIQRALMHLEKMRVNGSGERAEPEDETPYQSLSPSAAPDAAPAPAPAPIPAPPPAYNNNLHDKLPERTPSPAPLAELRAKAGAGAAAVSSKEKKRRRWGVFVARGLDVKSATLGRERGAGGGAGGAPGGGPGAGKARAPPAGVPPAPPGAPPHLKHRWSTGLPKYQPLPPTITKETLCEILERKASDKAISWAWEQIPKERPGAPGAAPAPAAAPGEGALSLPYDDNRVRLSPTPDNKRGYVNASHITMTVGSRQRFYVMCVAGEGGGEDEGGGGEGGAGGRVWEVAWRVGAALVAWVGGDAPPPYLPAQTDTDTTYHKCVVSVECVSACEWGETARVSVRRAGAGARTLWHCRYKLWPPTLTTPERPATFLAFLSEVCGLRGGGGGAQGEAQEAGPPVVWACARGDKSGTALAADLLLHTLQHNLQLEPERAVGQLHQQRAHLVPSLHHYAFLHRLLVHHLSSTRLI